MISRFLRDQLAIFEFLWREDDKTVKQLLLLFSNFGWLCIHHWNHKYKVRGSIITSPLFDKQWRFWPKK